jgi:predicted RNase H-like HicB family nuclease
MATRALPRSRYLDRPYRIVMTRDGRGARAGWIAHVEELPGCEAGGATMEEAGAAIREAMELWISDALESGRAIPAPMMPVIKPGPLELDLPHSLKVALTKSAVNHSMKLHDFITTVLAAAIGWGPSEEDGESTWIAGEAKRLRKPEGASNRLLRLTAIGNVVLLALVAIVAVVLLYVALKNA